MCLSKSPSVCRLYSRKLLRSKRETGKPLGGQYSYSREKRVWLDPEGSDGRMETWAGWKYVLTVESTGVDWLGTESTTERN